MLEKVAAMFTDAQLEVLNRDARFLTLCAEAESQEPIVARAQELIAKMPKKHTHPPIPPLPTRLQGPNVTPVVKSSGFQNAPQIPDMPFHTTVTTP